MSCSSKLFELKCILKNININLSSYIECGSKQLLALITSSNEIILHYMYAELAPVLKRIPWFNDSNKVISAICFDPTATWLLIVSVDGSLYILPALSLVDKRQKIDCKWSLNDLTHFSKHSVTPNVRPTCITWWQTLDCNQNTLVGYENGAIALISLTDGRCLGNCTINEPVTGLNLCHNNHSDPVSLLISGQSGQQWRLLLETQALGCVWPPESNNQNEETSKSRLHSLKQVGDKIASIKQKLTESRNSFSDNQSQCSDTSTESSHSDHKSIGPELLPHLCDTYFAPQFARNRFLFSAFYKPSSLLTVHTFSIESAPLYVYKLIPKTKTVLLTDLFIYTVSEDKNEVGVISSFLSESRLEGDTEFNVESLIDKFKIEEEILRIYKHSDLNLSKSRNIKDSSKNRFSELPKSVDDLNIPRPKVDTCIIITDKSVYKIVLNTSPIHKFIHYVNKDNNLIAAEKLSTIFSLNIQHLLECCGDLMIANGAFHSGIILYKQAKVHLLKRVLKLAVAADCRTLLKFVHLCLSASRVDMSVTTKIHIGNLAVMAYTELILRFGGSVRLSNTKDFMKFLCYEEYYDQILAVNVACQVGLWNIVSLLGRARGLQPEVVTAFGQILQSARAPRPNDHNFLLALSEPSLTQSLLVSPLSCQNIFQYIRANVDVFPLDILERFIIQLDPSQSSAIPLVSRIFQSNRLSSSADTALESVSIENPDRTLVSVKDFIETFLLVLIKLTSKTDNTKFSLNFIHEIKQKEVINEEDDVFIEKLPDLTPLSAGYKHAAVVRNGNVYTMGLSNSGCLGTGPLLTHSSPPKIVHMLTSLKVEALSVTCGRKHTLVLTDHGVYSWGSNSHGQLGLGYSIQESPYPQMISELSMLKIVQVVTGQYHSLALTTSGTVYSWGWGIHGQLGHGTCNDQYIPKLLEFEHPVMQAAAGHAHSLLLTCDGRIFGFGSNVFGQLECCTIDSNKSSKPVLVVLMPDMFVPIRKVATSYFHNIAIREDEGVYIWGASPQEVRLAQSKNSQKQNGFINKNQEISKLAVKIYSGEPRRPVEKIAIGYKHTALVHKGKILWGKNKDDELSSPKLRDQDSLYVFTQRFIHVSCGLDYTMAIDNTGKLLAWGSQTMAQTILGKPHEDTNSSAGARLLVLRNTKRVIKLPGAIELDHYPVEVPGIPAMAITFGTTPYSNLLSKRLAHYRVLSIENSSDNNQSAQIFAEATNNQDVWQNINKGGPKIKCGQKTLHYALQLYYGIYDTESILLKCLDVNNYQAASKIAMLDGHYGDSLGFQLSAFKKYLESMNFDSFSMYTNKDDYDINEKDQTNFEPKLKEKCDRNIEKNVTQSATTEALFNNSQAYILSSSSSLDSIRQWGDDVEHQGGQESPCEVGDIGDIKQNVSCYVHSLKNSDSSISSVSKTLHESEVNNKNKDEPNEEKNSDPKDSQAREIIDIASYIVEFYTEKIHSSENHILMQNILLKCIEFWLSNSLPVSVLEKILLKNMDKYFYPLSILLFCKNFDSSFEDDIVKRDDVLLKSNSANFLKEFSNKFCLQLCSMVLENVNKA